MYNTLIALTAAICVFGMLIAYMRFKDVFHPLMLLLPMSAFMWVYMPYKLIQGDQMWKFLTIDQVTFVQVMVVLTVGAMTMGALTGSNQRATDTVRPVYTSQKSLHMGAYIVGGIGFLAWLYTLREAGGISGAFGNAYGGTWSEFGYLRDASYLVIVAVLLLISPEGIDLQNKLWWVAVAVFSFPWAIQALLGARRGPAFMMTVCIGMSWFLARQKRPSILVMGLAGFGLGFLMLFLVTNRNHICLNCDITSVKTDVSDVVTDASESNEYVFGTGCITASKVTGKCFYGKRYLAQIFVRPIPRQIWPKKYEDTGLIELTQNAGVAGLGLNTVMGWKAVQGAAAGMVADMWVEFSWFEIPVAWMIGWGMGRLWRKAIQEQNMWTTQYVIVCILSIYLITQSGEAVIFRLVIMSLPAYYVWRKANQAGAREVDAYGYLEDAPATSVHA